MNGRIYDPKLGRFLQTDPFVQAPKNSQNLNRYSYVLNNPLSYTDPTGFSFWKKVRPFVAIAVTIYLGPAAALVTGSWVAGGAIAGYVAGAIATGTVEGAFIGAAAGAAFGALHSWNAVGNARFGKTLAHGAVGGTSSVLSGGKFGHGFAAAGFTQAVGQYGGDFFVDGPAEIADRVGNAVKASIIGGTASVISGGKFAIGAVTGAFSRILNDDQHRLRNPATRKEAMAELKARAQAIEGSTIEYDLRFGTGMGLGFNLKLGAGVSFGAGYFEGTGYSSEYGSYNYTHLEGEFMTFTAFGSEAGMLGGYVESTGQGPMTVTENVERGYYKVRCCTVKGMTMSTSPTISVGGKLLFWQVQADLLIKPAQN